MLQLQLVMLFLFGYLAIIFEHIVRVNKSAIALTMGGLMWLVCFFHIQDTNVHLLMEELADIAQIILFLLSAMVIVEAIDAHRGFNLIAQFFHVKSRKVLLWILIFMSFVLSATLDNLTSIIILVSLLKKMVKNKEDRILLGAISVIAVNAGGAWTPLGDVTTTMLWINNKITSWGIISSLFVPSVVCVLIAGVLAQVSMGKKKESVVSKECIAIERSEPGSVIIIFLGLMSLILVPIWKAGLGLPPCIGGLLGFGLVWLASDFLHASFGESREHLRVPGILTKIDLSSIIFFVGILLAVDALAFVGILSDLSVFMGKYLSTDVIAMMLGLFSSVLDNVPLVAATMGMYNLPLDHSFWKLVAYTAGTGGSILIIGSAAGIAFMGLEKVNFLWYFKRVSWIALISYLGGILTYFLMNHCLICKV